MGLINVLRQRATDIQAMSGTGLRGSWCHRLRRNLKPNLEQRRTIYTLLVMFAIITIMYQFTFTRLFLFPFEMISTIFHEFGHALACWMTGGKVTEIVISPDESGFTRFVGGWTCMVAPAGYVGSAIAGAVLLFGGFAPEKYAKYMALGVNAILLLTLYWASSWFTRVMALVLIGMVGITWWWKEGILVRYLVLFMGAIGSILSLLSIFSTTVIHTIQGSDAVVFAKQCSILIPAFIYGFLWLIISIGIICISVGLALIVFK